MANSLQAWASTIRDTDTDVLKDTMVDIFFALYGDCGEYNADKAWNADTLDEVARTLSRLFQI